MAVGLSDDERMGDDLTTECVPENGRVNLYSSLTSASPYAAVRSSVVCLCGYEILIQDVLKESLFLEPKLSPPAGRLAGGRRHILPGPARCSDHRTGTKL